MIEKFSINVAVENICFSDQNAVSIAHKECNVDDHSIP